MSVCRFCRAKTSRWELLPTPKGAACPDCFDEYAMAQECREMNARENERGEQEETYDDRG